MATPTPSFATDESESSSYVPKWQQRANKRQQCLSDLRTAREKISPSPSSISPQASYDVASSPTFSSGSPLLAGSRPTHKRTSILTSTSPLTQYSSQENFGFKASDSPLQASALNTHALDTSISWITCSDTENTSAHAMDPGYMFGGFHATPAPDQPFRERARLPGDNSPSNKVKLFDVNKMVSAFDRKKKRELSNLGASALTATLAPSTESLAPQPLQSRFSPPKATARGASEREDLKALRDFFKSNPARPEDKAASHEPKSSFDWESDDEGDLELSKSGTSFKSRKQRLRSTKDKAQADGKAGKGSVVVEDDKASEWTDARESADEVRGVGSWEDQEHALEHAGNRAQTQSLVGGPSGSKATLKGEVGPLRDPSVQWSFQDPVWGRDYNVRQTAADKVDFTSSHSFDGSRKSALLPLPDKYGGPLPPSESAMSSSNFRQVNWNQHGRGLSALIDPDCLPQSSNSLLTQTDATSYLTRKSTSDSKCDHSSRTSSETNTISSGSRTLPPRLDINITRHTEFEATHTASSEGSASSGGSSMSKLRSFLKRGVSSNDLSKGCGSPDISRQSPNYLKSPDQDIFQGDGDRAVTECYSHNDPRYKRAENMQQSPSFGSARQLSSVCSPATSSTSTRPSPTVTTSAKPSPLGMHHSAATESIDSSNVTQEQEVGLGIHSQPGIDLSKHDPFFSPQKYEEPDAMRKLNTTAGSHQPDPQSPTPKGNRGRKAGLPREMGSIPEVQSNLSSARPQGLAESQSERRSDNILPDTRSQDDREDPYNSEQSTTDVKQSLHDIRSASMTPKEEDAASINTIESDAIPLPLNVPKTRVNYLRGNAFAQEEAAKRKQENQVPTARVARSSQEFGPRDPGSFEPRRNSGFRRMIREKSTQQASKLGTHPALRDEEEDWHSTSEYSDDDDGDNDPKSIAERGRVDSGIEITGSSIADEGNGTSNISQKDFAYQSPEASTHSTDEGEGKLRQSRIPTLMALSDDSTQQATGVDLQSVRREMGLPPAHLPAGLNSPKHPNHPFTWGHEKVMCYGVHNPPSVQPVMPAIPEGQPVDMSRLAPKFFNTTPNKRKVIGVKTCASCGAQCCAFAHQMIQSKRHTSGDLTEEAIRMKAEQRVKNLCDHHPNGIEEYETFIKCVSCELKICPGCCMKCSEPACQAIVCTECTPVSGVCPVHNLE